MSQVVISSKGIANTLSSKLVEKRNNTETSGYDEYERFRNMKLKF